MSIPGQCTHLISNTQWIKLTQDTWSLSFSDKSFVLNANLNFSDSQIVAHISNAKYHATKHSTCSVFLFVYVCVFVFVFAFKSYTSTIYFVIYQSQLFQVANDKLQSKECEKNNLILFFWKFERETKQRHWNIKIHTIWKYLISQYIFEGTKIIQGDILSRVTIVTIIAVVIIQTDV